MVLGATGYTGRLVVAELHRKNLSFGIAGRNSRKLLALAEEFNLPGETPVVVANPLKPQTLAFLFNPQTELLINCAGPFTFLGEAVVKAALDNNVHYLDISGEQKFIADIITRYHLQALTRKKAVLPGCGVEYSLTNWCAALAAEGLEPLDSLSTATATFKLKTTRGTRRSLLAALSSFGMGWKDGKRVIKPAGSEIKNFQFPPPFGLRRAALVPFGDPLTLPRHIQVKQVDSFIALPALLAWSLKLLSPVLPVVSGVLGFLAGWLVGSGSQGPGPDQRKEGLWAVLAKARGPRGTRTTLLKGKDVYGLTAVIVAWEAEKILGPEFNKSGVLGPAQAFDPLEAVTYLKQWGVEFWPGG